MRALEWVLTILGAALLIRWSVTEDLESLVLMSMCFILAAVYGTRL